MGMLGKVGNWIDTLLFGVRTILAGDSSQMPERSAMRFEFPFVLTDDTINGVTGVKLPPAMLAGERMLSAGVQSTQDTAGWTVIGALVVDPASFGTRNATWSAILSTTNAGAASQVRLVQDPATTNTVVASLSSTSLTSEEKGAPIVLAFGSHVYELQIKLGAIGAPERALCHQSKLQISWSV